MLIWKNAVRSSEFNDGKTDRMIPKLKCLQDQNTTNIETDRVINFCFICKNIC